MSFTAACIQLRSTTDVAENIATVERMVREAAAAGAPPGLRLRRANGARPKGGQSDPGQRVCH